MDAQRNTKSLRRGPNSRTTATERPPLSDLSNFNLTPIEALRNLCCSTTVTTASGVSSAGPYSSTPRSTVLRSPISVSGSVSKSSKPYNDNSTDARSETSVGSSPSVQIRNAGKFGLSAPLRIATTSHSSHNTSASADGELAVFDQRVTTTKSKGEMEATILPCSTIRENKRGNGEAVSDPVICLAPGSNKENDKDMLDHVNQLSTEKKKNMGKGNSGSLGSPPPKAKKDRENPTVNDANEISDDPLKSSTSRKIMGRRTSHKLGFSCPPLPKTRNTRSNVSEAESSGSMTDPNKKRTKKRRSGEQCFTEYVLPREFVEKQRAHFKEIDEFELVEEEASE